ncbi:N-acetyltransferase [Flexivirga endophytica]|uniref:N-acetyltransferase n=1 Tax=Flexivirga endophytica TaxID=1849103 RepID=A0A916TGT0_9MICO|nr:GNAT family N-acetyltransferase [Flexivirga endophytica]GGB42560.1 N-acetyltransferase [Flexivirga endophytica]GHB64101.1 N-acetyltransferase [Flexivirga endophytica]
MTDITVRALGDEEWQVYRDVRLTALREAPDAFAASVSQEEKFDDELWQARIKRSRRLVAEDGDKIVGVVSVGSKPGNDERVSELFGLWVDPELRGKGVAWKLVDAGVRQARQDSYDFVLYWVGTDNGRAVAFASSFGFRPTDGRRAMQSEAEDDASSEDEMAMVYPLGDDPGAVPSSVL